jgi:hypothetical protein
MKKYVFTGIACLSFLAVSCAQQTEQPIQPALEAPEGDQLPHWDEGRLLPSSHPTTGFDMFFVGQTTYQSRLNPRAWFDRPVQKPDLGSIAVNGNAPQMIAFGGGMTAGVSNGGLNREAQQFAYPNLVARQMGIVDFKTPLLSEVEANGTGIFVYEDPKAEYPRWREVTNNLAKLEAGKPVKMTPYEGVVHNFAYPGGGSTAMVYPYCPDCASQAYKSRLSSYEILPETYLLGDIRKKQAFDFVIFDDFFDSYMYWISRTDRLDGRFEMANGDFPNMPTYGMEHVLDKSQKGLLFTVPHFKHMGFMKWYDVEALKRKVSLISLVYWANNKGNVTDGGQTFFLKPTPNVEGLFKAVEKGKALDGKLFDGDIIDAGEHWFSDPDKVINPSIRKFANKHDLALVDLRSIYEEIHKGRYVTDDGLLIDGSMQGNFFSSDGIYPTPLGQAVIANEVIKAINNKYGARIPLINVSEFVLTTSSK